MDLIDAIVMLAEQHFDPPCTPLDVVETAGNGEYTMDDVFGDVQDGEITDAVIVLAFRTVIQASAEDLEDAVEEISCAGHR